MLICSWIDVSRHEIVGYVELRLFLLTWTFLHWIQIIIAIALSISFIFMSCFDIHLRQQKGGFQKKYMWCWLSNSSNVNHVLWEKQGTKTKSMLQHCIQALFLGKRKPCQQLDTSPCNYGEMHTHLPPWLRDQFQFEALAANVQDDWPQWLCSQSCSWNRQGQWFSHDHKCQQNQHPDSSHSQIIWCIKKRTFEHVAFRYLPFKFNADSWECLWQNM